MTINIANVYCRVFYFVCLGGAVVILLALILEFLSLNSPKEARRSQEHSHGFIVSSAACSVHFTP